MEIENRMPSADLLCIKLPNLHNSFICKPFVNVNKMDLKAIDYFLLDSNRTKHKILYNMQKNRPSAHELYKY